MSVAGTVICSQKLPYASKWVVIQDYIISFYICIVFQFHKLIINSTLYVLLVNWGQNTGIFRLPLIVITPQIWHLNTKKPYIIDDTIYDIRRDAGHQTIYMSETQFSMRLLHSYLLLITKLTTPNRDKVFFGFIL